VALALSSSAALAGPQAPAVVPASSLKACAGIAAPSERLACYDQLAAATSAAAAAPAAGAAPPASAPVRAAAPAPVAAAAPAAGAAAVAGGAAAAATPPAKDSFGLYAAEHPVAPAPASSVTLKVVGLGASAGGHPTVALEGGQLWELEEGDPLLNAGDQVTIKRATLGSFLMTTPSGRTHRAHRLH
jgi:hypothetical protein